MAIGERLRQVRLERGLSQRQLCQGLITRNMLSQIENGSARPSMEVLCTLAARLDRPVSFFLEEAVVLSSNQEGMARAREAYAQGHFQEALTYLAAYREPDALFDGERSLLEALCCLKLAGEAVKEDKEPYALQLLDRCRAAGEKTPYYGPELERARHLLLGRLHPQLLGSPKELEEELLLRGQAALSRGEYGRAEKLLEAVEERTGFWYLLRGTVAVEMGQYAQAAELLHRAEEAFPRETAGKLEICYRELGDYKKAYEYAKK